MNSYLIAICPPADISKNILILQAKYFQESFYKIDPHITLVPPFHLINSSQKGISHSITQSLIDVVSTELKISRFDFFTGKNNVAFLEFNKPSINFLRKIIKQLNLSLNKQILNEYDDYKIDYKSFIPHITLAEHIKNSELKLIEEKLNSENYDFNFLVNSVWLYKQKEGSNTWKKIKKISFGSHE